ncbi:MAG TPA: 50S ribosomal protein L10 [Candidatus Paceibacterota bacterium]|jgi:large subunit ribosomal protein L10|nr:50S ribosomal protein L10 [Parcubacteria group bacterium]MDP6119393.1 50S ribosomal protein L10 [Candidatus Paceibacterota bacterium]HJN62705.1 50S ribosomal protein L10 [Candidatus Paceibacterota bacterium]|tara:strand:+ start:3217 stop:3708 length:492 start_codon:yes stop_codon:yes gene_type:complete
MAINRDKKKEILERLKKILDKSKSITFVNFHGLSVKDTTSMRDRLREEGVGYFVSKKTLANLALKDSKVKGDIPLFDGELAFAFSEDDETAPARKIYDFGKEFKDKLHILGGIFEGVFKNKEEMMEIATIPSPQVLKGMFVNVINSPIQGLVIALNGIAEKKQ